MSGSASRCAKACVAPTALGCSHAVHPVLADWAKLCRAYGARATSIRRNQDCIGLSRDEKRKGMSEQPRVESITVARRAEERRIETLRG